MLDYRSIPLESYPRRAHFEYFKSMAQPYAGVTAEVDITQFLRHVRHSSLPFFLSFLYCASRAANAVPELRQRILNEGIIEYPWCPTSHTVALEDGTYCYCQLNSDMPFDIYLPYALERQAAAKRRPSLQDGSDSLALLFVSSVPWLTYQALIQPIPSPADSNPRITWGRFYEKDSRILIPVTLLCHHALADGLHISCFYRRLEQEFSRFSSTFPSPAPGETL